MDCDESEEESEDSEGDRLANSNDASKTDYK